MSFDYNEGNQLTGTSSVKPGTVTKISSKYEYDDDGRLKKITGNGQGSLSADYVYNDLAGTEKLNRLTQAKITDAGNNYTLDYSCDPAGNIKSMDVPNGLAEQTNPFTYEGIIRSKILIIKYKK